MVWLTSWPAPVGAAVRACRVAAAVSFVGLLLALTVAGPSGAAAGDTFCEDLWHQRNSVFAKRGYCFETTAGHIAFPESCFPPYGELSEADKAVVAAIRSLEAENGCDRPGTATPAADSEILPIIVGGDASYDACASTARVKGLKSSGDGYLSVRSSPSGVETDRVENGRYVFICNEIAPWMGIVYPEPGQDPAACGVSSSLETQELYEGPCRSGWVHQDYLGDIAG